MSKGQPQTARTRTKPFGFQYQQVNLPLKDHPTTAELNLTSEKMHASGSNLTSIRLREAVVFVRAIKHLQSHMSKSRPSATSIKIEATVATNSSLEVNLEPQEI